MSLVSALCRELGWHTLPEALSYAGTQPGAPCAVTTCPCYSPHTLGAQRAGAEVYLCLAQWVSVNE